MARVFYGLFADFVCCKVGLGSEGVRLDLLCVRILPRRIMASGVLCIAQKVMLIRFGYAGT